ncbi:TRAP transporter permease [Niallia endozanthoxylica]|uniref:TRAP transporter fused permease subunit n=1 Tax=Niallia endozanthoxylica TaxID=2036016 RepID=A0A5J5HG10_9BACI|nr:TRAP transporter fused permease subunit [Niallia endozanthoxylica]KAA9019495.1 TRAP transporter fused permease subunit [Niallia endozanthoxylica]
MNLKNRLTAWLTEGERRQLSGLHLKLFVYFAFLLSLFQVWSVVWGKLAPIQLMATHLTFILVLTFLLYSFSKKTDSRHIPTKMDWICSFFALGAGVYFTIHADRIAVRIPIIDSLSTLDIFFGFLFVILSIEAARRTIGVPIVIIVLMGISYALWGHHLDSLLWHRKFSFPEVVEDLAYSFNGLWGSPIAVAASFVYMFLLFGSFLQKAGAGEFFFQLSTALAGRSRGGAAKVAVLASAFFGTISGSPTANVVTTGTFTIPVSKKSGYKPSFAAAVEAAASTGGSILPPIMGSSAFLMAAITQLPYISIAMAAIIPSILYYLSLLAMVHFEAVRLNLPTAKKEEIPKASQVLKEGWYYFIPLIVLILLLLRGYSASMTGLFGILAIVVVSWFRKQTRMGVKEIFVAMVDGAKSSIPVTTACAAAGLVIAGIMSTGLGGKLTSIVLGLTEGLLLPTLLLVMLICIVLGMGMPVAAAYILTAMLAAPALMELGVSLMSAHLFIVYFSIFSAITPPVAVAAYAAAGIAESNPNQVGLEAVRLGLVGFIVPFMFVLEPALLLEGSLTQIMISFLTALLGVVTFGAGVIGWLKTKTTIIDRLLLITSGLLLIYPHILYSAIGIGLVILVFVVQTKRSRTVELSTPS